MILTVHVIPRVLQSSQNYILLCFSIATINTLSNIHNMNNSLHGYVLQYFTDIAGLLYILLLSYVLIIRTTGTSIHGIHYLLLQYVIYICHIFLSLYIDRLTSYIIIKLSRNHDRISITYYKSSFIHSHISSPYLTGGRISRP